MRVCVCVCLFVCVLETLTHSERITDMRVLRTKDAVELPLSKLAISDFRPLHETKDVVVVVVQPRKCCEIK